ncbi:Hypothetical predicted protein [Cloeon dipterum]|uniref:GPN-loop GTPase 3 n=1 Tax=Cloeon dipterum TaxID=197152 RepID=A0A8S1BMT0_9INSE|nr:Hypothetical predicted protein [Cloeon dipterum]
MRYAQLVMGPAGSGKSTYCALMMKHAQTVKHTMEVVNLDPAAEYFDYTPSKDIRDLIKLDDVMEDEDLSLGPNGGLVFCMEYMLQNKDWLEEAFGEGAEDDYIIFDCPGQIELYTHMTVFQELAELLQRWGFQVCGVFLLDSQFMVDGAKFLSGTTAALSTMVNLQIPHVNVLTKIDLLSKSVRKELDKYLLPDTEELMGTMEHTSKWGQKYCKLTEALGNVIENFSLVRFIPLDRRDEENIADVLLQIDMAIQYGEDLDVKTKDFDYPDPEDQEDE